jgi:hypothetical protein
MARAIRVSVLVNPNATPFSVPWFPALDKPKT